MITVAMSTTVGVRRDRLWRALSDASELALWNPGRIEPFGPMDGYPRPGQCARWHCRLGRVPVTLVEKFLEVIPGERLHVAMALGPFRFQATYTLATNGDLDKAQLGLRLVAANVVPVAGGVLDRFEVRRVATGLVTDTLEAARSWCEREGPTAVPRRQPSPPAPVQSSLFQV